MQAAWAAIRKKDSYWFAKFKKLRYRMGAKAAIVVIARKMLVVGYHILKNMCSYKELGANYVDEKANERRKKYYTKQLEKLGFEVALTQTA